MRVLSNGHGCTLSLVKIWTIYSKVDSGDLVPEEDTHDWTHIMIEGGRNPELLKEFYQTTLKGYVCVRALNLCCFIFVFCLLGSKDERLSLRQKQSKQPITNKSKFDLLEEHTASSDSTVKVKRLLLLYLCIKHINCLLINI
jgi:hypothetical protein